MLADANVEIYETSLYLFDAPRLKNSLNRKGPRPSNCPLLRSIHARGEGMADSQDAERTDGGIVAKRRDGPYLSGERAMVKIKPLRSADCVVGGFRYLANKKQVGSLLLGLYNDVGKLDHVGFTSTIRNEDRAALTKRLEKAPRAARFHRQCSRRSKPLEH